MFVTLYVYKVWLGFGPMPGAHSVVLMFLFCAPPKSQTTPTVFSFFPILYRFDEIWKGRTSFSDRQARMESIEVLKKMIKSWLDDSYPGMPEHERQRLANDMDVSLVENMKETYMKSLGLNTLEVVRMSFIEMQWLKKVM